MREELKIILLSILAGAALWVVDALADPLFYKAPFAALLFYGGSSHDFFMRAVIFVSFVLFGLVISKVAAAHRRAERALTEKSVYLDNILESATEYAIVTTDRDFRITYYNSMAEKLFGYPCSKAVGKTVMEMHALEGVTPERFAGAMENVRKTGEHFYLISRETDAGARFIEARVSVIRNSRGELVGYSNFSRDVTSKRLSDQEREDLINELKEALAKVETLKGLLPICSYCKKIRDDGGYWSQIETYIRRHSNAEFTHSICPECEKKAQEF